MIRPSRVGLVHGAFALFAIVLVGRAAQVQIFQTAQWRAKARNQQLAAWPEMDAGSRASRRGDARGNGARKQQGMK